MKFEPYSEDSLAHNEPFFYISEWQSGFWDGMEDAFDDLPATGNPVTELNPMPASAF